MSSAPATTSSPECCLVIPLYRNEENVAQLIERVRQIDAGVPGGIEAVFVVDGSPDATHQLLEQALPGLGVQTRLLLLSRNFGSFAAIRVGLRVAGGRYFAVMAADLQEPAELILEFFRVLREEPVDVALGTREGRADPWFKRLTSMLFWASYRRLVQPEVPRGGIDVFACNLTFRDQLLRFDEAHSSLVGQLLWLGFRRREIPYSRLARASGRSAWTLGKKLRYLSDSLFSFSDLPIRVFLFLGGLGLLVTLLFSIAVAVARLTGAVEVPGYAATVITILFFSGLNLLGLGIIGSYVWRAYENTKSRPLAVVMHDRSYTPEQG